jgi:hypothetical protein
MRTVLSHLPGITAACIEEMIDKVAGTAASVIHHLCHLTTVQVDRDGDGRISYSEFRVMMGAHPLIIH